MGTMKQCANGHYYDSAIYGNTCPFCPTGGETFINNGGGTEVSDAGGTIPNGGGGTIPNGGGGTIPNNGGNVDPTIKWNPKNQTKPAGGTVIRPAGSSDAPNQQGRKLVGFLVTYSTDSMGESFKLYEGKNFVGKSVTCDIAITKDQAISDKHLTILYRAGKYLFKDEMSTNGTIVNGELLEDGHLKNQDVITIGQTTFVFLAIPAEFLK